MVWFYLSFLSTIVSISFSLSIPLWSDFIFTNKYVTIFVFILSIPLWSDFIPAVCIIVNVIIDNFQSHYGLILSRFYPITFEFAFTFQSHYGLILSQRDYDRVNARSQSFQSHYGLILSIYGGDMCEVCVELSIPLWSDFIWESRTSLLN